MLFRSKRASISVPVLSAFVVRLDANGDCTDVESWSQVRNGSAKYLTTTGPSDQRCKALQMERMCSEASSTTLNSSEDVEDSQHHTARQHQSVYVPANSTGIGVSVTFRTTLERRRACSRDAAAKDRTSSNVSAGMTTAGEQRLCS